MPAVLVADIPEMNAACHAVALVKSLMLAPLGWRIAATFWRAPGDTLHWISDVAGIAKDATLRVDLEPRRDCFLYDFIDTGRTLARAGQRSHRLPGLVGGP